MKITNISHAETTKLDTYADLKNAYVEKLISENKSNQIIKNAKSALSSWIRALNSSTESNFNSAMLENFDNNIQLYEKHEKESQVKCSTYKSRISILKSIRSFACSINEDELPKNFAERLKFLLEAKNISVSSLSKHPNLDHKEIYNIRYWLRGRMPHYDSYETVENIEKALEVPPATLLSTLPLSNEHLKRTLPTIAYRKNLKIATKQKYAMWSADVESEFLAVIEYKTAIIPPKGLKRYKNAVWTKNENGEIPTAILFKKILKRFFGYCCLAADSDDPRFKGAGIDEKDLTIALLTEIPLLEGHLSFIKARAGGKYNNWHIRFISKVTSLLKEETGYLYQQPEFAVKLKKPLTKRNWEKRCLEARSYLLKIRNGIFEAQKSGNNEVGCSRDPSEPIRSILELNNPLQETLKIVENLVNDAEKYPENSLRRAILYRDALLLAMLQANPLRVYMFSIMKINENLIKENGLWWLKFNRNEFKNGKNLKSDYTVRLADEIYFIIEEYLTKYRQRILKLRESDYVFVSSPNRGEQSTKLYSTTISRIVRQCTRKYLDDCPGIGPHSFRHIVATSIIKNDLSRGFYLAAKALNNTVRTIESNYAHLKTSELFEPYNEFFKENWNKVVKKNSDGEIN